MLTSNLEPLPLFSTLVPPLSSIKLARMNLLLIDQTSKRIVESDREWPDHHDEYHSLHGLIQDGWKWGFSSLSVVHAWPSQNFTTQRNLTSDNVLRKCTSNSTLITVWVDSQERSLTRLGFRLRRRDSVICNSRNTSSWLEGTPASPQMANATSLGSLVIWGIRGQIFSGWVPCPHRWLRARTTSCGMPEVPI